MLLKILIILGVTALGIVGLCIYARMTKNQPVAPYRGCCGNCRSCLSHCEEQQAESKDSKPE